MKLKLKTDGLTGDSLAFATKLQEALDGMPEAMDKAEAIKLFSEEVGKLFGVKEGGGINIAFLDTIKDMNDPAKEGSIKHSLIEQGNKINSILEQIGKGMNGVTTLEQFKKDFDAAVKDGKFDEIKQNKAGAVSFVIKAAAVTTRTGAVSDSASDLSNQLVGNDGAQIFEIKRGTPFILDFVTVGNTDAPAIIWFDETQKQGDFAVTAEGAVKPLVEYIWVRQSADYRKAAGRAVITEEFDKDYPRIVSKIKQLMNIDCRNEMNALILTDMISQASAFTFAGLNSAIATPDDYAAIGAAICQLQNFFYTPNVLVLNPADAWTMRLTKDLQGRYQMNPLSGKDGNYEFGAIITDPRVPIGNAFVGDGSIYNVDLRGDLIVRMGYSTGDFEANQYTLLVEQYFFNYISQAKKPGFVYFSFAAVKAAIAA